MTRETIDFSLGLLGIGGKFRYPITKAGGKTLRVGRVPSRKAVALYTESPGMNMPLAYFRSEQAAKEFLHMIYPGVFVEDGP